MKVYLVIITAAMVAGGSAYALMHPPGATVASKPQAHLTDKVPKVRVPRLGAAASGLLTDPLQGTSRGYTLTGSIEGRPYDIRWLDGPPPGNPVQITR